MRTITPTYVRLLNMINALRQMSPLNQLTADETVMLDALIVIWHERGPVTVSEIMNNGQFGSQSTAYRRIIALSEKGFVDLRIDSADRRVKFVDPTEIAHRYMKELGGFLGQLKTLGSAP